MIPPHEAPGNKPVTAASTSGTVTIHRDAQSARSRHILASIMGVLALMAVAAGGVLVFWVPAQNSTSTAVAEVMQVDGLMHLVTGADVLRIQQPDSFEFAELEAAGVELGRELNQMVVVSEPTDSRLVVVPPDGPDARMHLLVDGALHPLVVNDAERVDLSELGAAPVTILGQLDVAG